MVDEEKQSNELNGQESLKEPEKGGEETKPKKDEKTLKVKSVNEKTPLPFDKEENEYSIEEYQKFVDLYDRTLSDISPGQIVMGRVLAVSEQDVLVDIGFKSEGSIPLEEFGDPPEVKVGDKIEVFLETIEDSDGQLLLSKRKANFVRLWDKVVEVYNEGGTIEGSCVRRIKGGIVVDLNGVDAFLPGSQIDVKPIRDFDALIGKTFTFKVVKVNKLRRNIVVSRRAILEESMKEQRDTILHDLEKGQVRKGTVKNITDFGVFVDLGGVDGLLHINDLSWGRINHPSEVVKLDEEIEVTVLDYNDAKDRISLGMKQLQPHPWENIQEKYPPESVVKGKVVSIADYGAFVELEKGVEGLIHVSEMSWTRHGIHPSKIVNVGEVVEVKILNIDKDKKRISLGLKQLTPDPWEDISEKYPVGSKLKGRVRNMTNFGAFIEIEEGIDGLVHISDLSWTKKIKHPSEVLKKGEEIEVMVMDISKSDRRISLGYKQLTDDPWETFEEKYKVDTVTKGKVLRFVDKGLVIELSLGLEGFIPLSQMQEPTMDKVKKKIKEGDELDFLVIEFDRENKRVVLSQNKLAEIEQKKEKGSEKAEVEAYIEKQESATTLGEIADKESKEEASAEKKEKKKAGKDASESPVQEELALDVPDEEEKKDEIPPETSDKMTDESDQQDEEEKKDEIPPETSDKMTDESNQQDEEEKKDEIPPETSDNVIDESDQQDVKEKKDDTPAETKEEKKKEGTKEEPLKEKKDAGEEEKS
jgi:small subunit ribosomal protein S1